MLKRARAHSKAIGNTSKIQNRSTMLSAVDLQEVWVQEINLNYVHKELTGDVNQPHNLEKQQH